jgi:hypothetical protein
MTNARVEVVTTVQRRRRWSVAEKAQLVAATLEPGASVSAVGARSGDAREPALWLAAPAVLPSGCRASLRGGSGSSGAGSDGVSQCGGDRHRVCGRRPNADHGRGRPGDRDGGGGGAVGRATTMIPVPVVAAPPRAAWQFPPCSRQDIALHPRPRRPSRHRRAGHQTRCGRRLPAFGARGKPP